MVSPFSYSTFARIMKTRYYIIPLMLLALCMGMITSCDDDETYADQKKHENSAINGFLEKGCCVMMDNNIDTLLYVPPVKVIDEETFKKQDSTTNIALNEYVLLRSTGIYMQIVNKGGGEKLAHGQDTTLLARYIEFNIMGDSIYSLNCKNNTFVSSYDKMTVNNKYGVISGSFISGMMMKIHSSAYIPEGWLVPLSFVNITRDLSNIAKVRLIVPHASGTSDASANVCPYFYEITYQVGRT